jgi:hypothetical protein
MKTAFLLTIALVIALGSVGLFPSSAKAQTPEVITLPDPQKSGGMPLFEALANRHSNRGFRPDTLSLQHISNILWCAFGVNRSDGSRTIPTSHGYKELAVYAVIAKGVYLYDADHNTLTKVLNGDRTLDYGGAPLTLLYSAPTKDGPVGGFHAGSAYQGVGLYCASEGLANVVKTTGANNLAGELPVQEGWPVLVVQSIGFPAQ